jgi:hypothetical protein
VSNEVVFYLEVAGDPEEIAARLRAEIAALDEVEAVEAQAEEPERGALETINSVTVTVTALGGAVGATTLLIDHVQRLLTRFGVQSAQVETDEGMRQLDGEPTNEKPAQ